MRIRAAVPFIVVLSVIALAVQANEEKKAATKQAGLDRFKQLAGEWSGKMSHEGQAIDATVTYKVTSNGTAVVETLGPGSEHEMVTVIHQDGDKLALTHYCALGNQPHMKADAKGDGNKFAFDFVSASNLKSDKDMHMHSVTYTFVDNDTLKADWTHYQDGKKAGTASFEMKRKK